MNRDLYNNIKIVQSLAPATLTAVVDGAGVDTLGYESAVMFLDVGTQAGDSGTFKFQHSDDNSTFADIPAAELLGEASATAGDPLVITTANDAAIYKRGYIGSKRYLRIVNSAETTAENIPVYAGVILGNPRHAPTA